MPILRSLHIKDFNKKQKFRLEFLFLFENYLIAKVLNTV